MLEKVSESGLAEFLVFRTYVVPDTHRDYGGFAIFMDDDVSRIYVDGCADPDSLSERDRTRFRLLIGAGLSKSSRN